MTTDVIDCYRPRRDSQWLTRHPATSMTPPDAYNRVALDYITTNKKDPFPPLTRFPLPPELLFFSCLLPLPSSPRRDEACRCVQLPSIGCARRRLSCRASPPPPRPGGPSSGVGPDSSCSSKEVVMMRLRARIIMSGWMCGTMRRPPRLKSMSLSKTTRDCSYR